ncbi:Hypothetical predicted protein [Pelobates cultripes]|uniref:L1 transposable element RRM domain-containing protein n=1 Tax=Pelobates cultripes TaxID=61616 RepID=A0AAD1TDT0_PELCU|nr:Hypothetical predicted protein [Pelobates cultripes]
MPSLNPSMGGGKKTRNSAVAPIFQQKAAKAQAPSSANSPSDSDSEISSHTVPDRVEAPLTRRDRRGFLENFHKSVAEELDKKLGPIMEGMADLKSARRPLNQKAMEVVQAHGGELQDLREQLRSLEDSNEDLNNRTRRNNIRVRGIPETISTELLTATLTEVFQHLLPEASTADLLMDRAHRALRAPSTNTATPRDVIVRLHFYHIKARIMKAARETPIEVEGVQVQLFQDLAPTTLKRRRDLRPLTQHLTQHGLRYAWGHPFKLIVCREGRFHSISHAAEIPALLDHLGLPRLPEPPPAASGIATSQAAYRNLPARDRNTLQPHAEIPRPDAAHS